MCRTLKLELIVVPKNHNPIASIITVHDNKLYIYCLFISKINNICHFKKQ